MLEHDWFPQPLPPNVEIGERSWLYSSFAFVHYRSQQACGVRIGNDTGVYAGTFFDLGPNGAIEIGDYCTVVGAIISSNRRIVIEDFVFVAHEVVIADEPFAVPAPSSEPEPARGTVLGRNAWIGARAVLVGDVQIGAGAIVGAAAFVEDDVPPFAIAAGNPARVVGWSRPSRVSANASTAPRGDHE